MHEVVKQFPVERENLPGQKSSSKDNLPDAAVWPRETDVINVRFYTDYNACNYSCPYCIAGQNNKANIVEKWDDTNFDAIIENLTRLPFKINIRLGVGGEFFLNKKLVADAKKLSHARNVKSVNLITNLSFSVAQYEKMLGDFDKKKLAVVASYHPTEVTDHARWLESAEYMQDNYDFAVIVVAYPPSLGILSALKKELNEHGHTVFVQSFVGDYEGKKYPYAYTQDEKQFLKSIFYSRHDYEFFVEAIKPGLCNSGYKSFYVDMTGEVIPCGMQIKYESMGNLARSPEIKLNRKPQMCRGKTCMCDTENMNTVAFAQHYNKSNKNQHVYTYRYAEEAKSDPRVDEWNIEYKEK